MQTSKRFRLIVNKSKLTSQDLKRKLTQLGLDETEIAQLLGPKFTKSN